MVASADPGIWTSSVLIKQLSEKGGKRFGDRSQKGTGEKINEDRLAACNASSHAQINMTHCWVFLDPYLLLSDT